MTVSVISIHLMLMLIGSVALFTKLPGFISIHLMLMLIVHRIDLRVAQQKNFNTSHVNVNPMNLSLFQSRLNLSLPILSHFLKNYQPISLFLTMGLISLLPQIFTGLLEIFFINCLVNTCII